MSMNPEFPKVSDRYMIGEKLICEFVMDFTQAVEKLNIPQGLSVIGGSVSFVSLQWEADKSFKDCLEDLKFFPGASEQDKITKQFLERALSSGMTVGEILSAYGRLLSSQASWLIRAEREEKKSGKKK